MLVRLCALSLSAGVLLGGCSVPSVNPLHSPDKVAFEAGLVGRWKAADEKGDDKVHTITAGEDKTYRLTMGEGDDKLDLVIHLVKLGDHYFTDTTLAQDDSEKLTERYAMLAVRTHLFARVDFSKPDTIVYRELDRDWLFGAVHKEPVPLAHSGTDAKSLVLTAPTKDLQKFVLDAARTDAAWTSPVTYKRTKPPAAATTAPAPEPKK